MSSIAQKSRVIAVALQTPYSKKKSSLDEPNMMIRAKKGNEICCVRAGRRRYRTNTDDLYSTSFYCAVEFLYSVSVRLPGVVTVLGVISFCLYNVLNCDLFCPVPGTSP